VTAEVKWDEEVSAAAAAALAKLCGMGDVRHMRPEAAERVLEQLHEEGPEHAPSVFRTGLGHADPNVRSRALSALNDLGEPALDEDERRLRALIDSDWDTVNELGPGPVVELLADQLLSKDRYHRKAAAEALGELKEVSAPDALVDALRDPDEDVRGHAVRALAALRELRAVEPIALLLKDPERWVREQAADALGTLGSEAALPALIGAMKDRLVAMRRAATRAVGCIGGAATVEPLGRALKDPDVEVRQSAVEGLVRIGTAEAVRYLTAAMGDADDGVRSAAARGLAQAQTDLTAVSSAPALDTEVALVAGMGGPGRAGRRAAAEALQALGWQPANDVQSARFLVAMENPLTAEELGEVAVEPLCVALLDGDHYYLCEQAAGCLGRLLDARATPALVQALKPSTDMTVRAAAADALGRIRDPSALPALEAALAREKEQYVKPRLHAAVASVRAAVGCDRLVAAMEDPEPKVAIRAAVLLARGGDARGIDRLARAARRDDWLVHSRAIAALGRLGGPEVIQKLVEIVRECSSSAGDAAANALVELGDAAIQPMVDALAGMKHNERRVLLLALARIGPPAMAPLGAALVSADCELKRTACQVLAYDRPDIPHRPVEPLVLLLSDPDVEVRSSAAHYLCQVLGYERPDPPHVPVEPLMVLLSDPDSRVRRCAVEALELLEWTPSDDRERALLEAARRR
jgi:HEAT repeat protein